MKKKHQQDLLRQEEEMKLMFKPKINSNYVVSREKMFASPNKNE